MNNLKRILTIALCSVLIVCAIPQFSIRSEAASTATYALYQTMLNLSGYLTTRGYSIAHENGSSIPSITELQTLSYDNLGQRLFDISLKLNAFGATHDLPDLGDQFVKAMSDASFRGSILLSKTVRDLVDLYFYTNTLNGSVNVGSIKGDITDISIPANTWISFTTPGISANYRNFSSSIPMNAFVVNNTVGFCGTYIDDYSFSATTNKYSYSLTHGSGYTVSTSYVTVDGKSYAYSYSSINLTAGKSFEYYDVSDQFTSVSDAIIAYLSGSISGYDIADLTVTQITDTSETDILTSTNTIASDGTIEGDTTIYLPDQATFENAIDGYNQGTLSYEDFLNVLGLSSVESDATVSEKEDALNVVVTPTDDYLWFTKTQWGADSLEETRKASASTRAEEDSLADSIANTANGGSDPEDPENKSRGKGLLALLLLGLGIWNTPIIAGDGTPSGGGANDGSGDDGSGDTSGYLAESIAGMAVAGSLVDDLFDSAGGSNGYGLIYTVGTSFVIFSVIIGAANYFGALFHGSDTKQNIKASGKRSTPGKEKKGG